MVLYSVVLDDSMYNQNNNIVVVDSVVSKLLSFVDAFN